MKTLSDKLREVIRDSGMSQEEIANAIGISAGILSRFMREERSMNLVTAAHSLGFAASWLTEWYAYDRKVLDGLGLGANEKIAYTYGLKRLGSQNTSLPPGCSIARIDESASPMWWYR